MERRPSRNERKTRKLSIYINKKNNMKLSQIFKEALLEVKKKKPSDMVKKEGAEGMDHEVSMAKNSLESIIKSAIELAKKMGDDERNIPGWIQDHISKAENFIDQAAQGFHELGGHEEEEEDSAMIQPVDEKKLTKAEKAKKEDIIKAMAMKGGGKDKMGPKQYAIATAQAIKSAE